MLIRFAKKTLNSAMIVSVGDVGTDTSRGRNSAFIEIETQNKVFRETFDGVDSVAQATARRAEIIDLWQKSLDGQSDLLEAIRKMSETKDPDPESGN